MLNNMAGYALSIIGAIFIGQLGALSLSSSVLANSVYNCTGGEDSGVHSTPGTTSFCCFVCRGWTYPRWQACRVTTTSYYYHSCTQDMMRNQ
jgi:hypothetical protein